MDIDSFESTLREKVGSIIEELLPEYPAAVTDVLLIWEGFDPDMQPGVMSIHTMARRPWLRVGLLQADMIDVSNEIAEMQGPYDQNGRIESPDEE